MVTTYRNTFTEEVRGLSTANQDLERHEHRQGRRLRE